MLDTLKFEVMDFGMSESSLDTLQTKHAPGCRIWILKSKDKNIQKTLRTTIVERIIPNSGNRHVQRSACVETSIPKLLFGNSIQEITEKDRDVTIEKIVSLLFSGYGITATYQSVLDAKLKRADFAANITLPISSKEFFNRIRPCTKKPGSEYTNTSYGEKRAGEQVHWYSKTRALSIYDKEAESQSAQPKLYALPHARKVGCKDNAFIRFEMRLLGNALRNRMQKHVGIASPTFFDVWNMKLSKNILLEELSLVPGLSNLLNSVTHRNLVFPPGCSKRDRLYVALLLRSIAENGSTYALKELQEAVSETTFYKIRRLLKECSNTNLVAVDIWKIIVDQLKSST